MCKQPTEEQVTASYVGELQRDGRLLLRHVARRTDRSVPSPSSTTNATDVSILMEPSQQVAGDPDKFRALASCVDMLSRQAAPANARSIRLTQAYLRTTPEGGEPSGEVMRRVKGVRLIVKLLIVLMLLAVVAAIMLLAHVDSGRRAVQQIQASQAERQRIETDLGKLARTAWIPAAAEAGGAFRLWCGDDDGLTPSATPEGATARALCHQRNEASLREDIIVRRIADWNRIFCGGWFLDRCDWTGDTGNKFDVPWQTHWERTEIRTAAAISKLTGFLLPLLMGFIGGCAYVLRHLDHKLSEFTLEIRDAWHAVLQVLLATMLGGLLGTLWSGDQPVQLGGFALTLAATAFFVGFALEAVFTFIEAMVEGVAGKLRAPTPQAQPR